MKKISNFSLLGYVVSIFILIFMGIRYLIIYYDLSQFLILSGIAGLIFAVSFLYNRIIQLGSTLGGIEDYLADKQEKLK